MIVRQIDVGGTAGERPSISLCLIVKNGESVAGRLVDCVGPYLGEPHRGEVVAVLNDCGDDTALVLREAARRHGLRCELMEVTSRTRPDLYFLDVPESYEEGQSLCGESFPGPFSGSPLLCDWSALRNLGWRRCGGEWRLFLDADDVVDDPECLPDLCRALSYQGVDVAASRYYHGGGQATVRERLCRNIPGIAWQGVVHEVLSGYDAMRAATVDGSLVVRDLRDSRGAGLRVPGRNLKVLYRRARMTRWSLTTREMVHLAAEARDSMPDLSVRLVEECVVRSTWDAERAFACYLRGTLDEAEGRHVDAGAWYRRSLDLRPTARVAQCLARISYLKDDYKEVLRLCEVARSCAGVLQFYDDGRCDLGDATSVLEAASLLAVGRVAEARATCEALCRRRPGISAVERLLGDIREREASGC